MHNRYFLISSYANLGKIGCTLKKVKLLKKNKFFLVVLFLSAPYLADSKL